MPNALKVPHEHVPLPAFLRYSAIVSLISLLAHTAHAAEVSTEKIGSDGDGIHKIGPEYTLGISSSYERVMGGKRVLCHFGIIELHLRPEIRRLHVTVDKKAVYGA